MRFIINLFENILDVEVNEIVGIRSTSREALIKKTVRQMSDCFGDTIEND